MWLDNYKFCKQGAMLALAKAGATSADTIIDMPGFVRSITGNNLTKISTAYTAWVYGLLGPIVAIEKSGGAVYNLNGPMIPIFGIGNTPVSADDYALAEPIDSSGLTFTPINPYWDKNANALVIPITITCVRENGVTITELGLKKKVSYGSYADNVRDVLMYREVLAQPFTLAQNETGTLTITVPYN